MFPGGGFGVGVTAAELHPAVPAVALPTGMVERPARLGEMLPVVGRSDEELAAELQRVCVAEGQLAAYKAELVAELAAGRSAGDDPRPGGPGAASPSWAEQSWAPEVSEFLPDELALVLGCSRSAATTLMESSLTLLGRLPATWAALADGRLDWPRARGLAAELGWPARDSDPAVIAQVEAAVLPIAGGLSVKGLRARARAELLARDAAAVEVRREQAQPAANVSVRPVGDGLAELVALMPQPLAAAARAAVDGYARLAKADGDPRPIGLLRVAALNDLLLRPWEVSRPAVTAQLSVVAPVETLRAAAAGASGAGLPPAEVDGQPVTGADVRALLESIDALCPGGRVRNAV